jgi:hypothetical protein
MLIPCPHCSIPVKQSNLDKHLRKVHAGPKPMSRGGSAGFLPEYRGGVSLKAESHVASRSPRYGGFRLCTCDGSNDNCRFCFGTGQVKLNRANLHAMPAHYEPRKDRKPRVKEPLVHLPPLEPSGGSWVTSNVAQRPKGYAPAPSPRAPRPGRRRDKRVVCPKCGQSVKAARLAGHLRKPHPAGKKNEQVKLKRTPASGTQRQAQDRRFRTTPLQPVGAGGRAARGADDLRYESPQAVRAMDHTRGYAHAFRESGRFGSHPSHDGFDDDSNP